MLELYICDDERDMRKRIQEIAEKKILIENYDMKIKFAGEDPEELLHTLEESGQKRNLYFLDVDFKREGLDGFFTGKQIRRLDPHGILIYITSFGDLAFRTFQYHLEAYDYLVKDPENLAGAIGKCLETVNEKLKEESRRDAEGVFSVKSGERVRHVPLSEILFFETSAKAHHVILNTDSLRVDFVGNMNEIEEQLGDRFLRVHRSYLAAADKIEEVDLRHNKVKIGGQECLVSRKMKSRLLEILGGRK